MKVHLTLKSANVKTGPIPVSTTEKDSCPTDCAMRSECYADSGPLALHWRAGTIDVQRSDGACYRVSGLSMAKGAAA